MNAFWANPERLGVLILRSGEPPLYLDAGPEFELAVAAGPRPFADLPSLSGEIEADPVPPSASALQVKLALYQLGYLPEVEAFIGAAGFVAQLAWREAGQFDRESPMLQQGAEAMGWPPERLDEVFRLAATIRV